MEQRDRPEIEITPEMIAAGAAVVRRFDDRFEDEECVAVDVFEAMISALDAPLVDLKRPPRGGAHRS